MRPCIVAFCWFAAWVYGGPASVQITVVKTLSGMSGPHAAVSADMMGGVSPKYLVGFINAGFSVRSKTDGHEIQPAQTLEQFWGAAFKNAGSDLAGSPYDPRIFYDPLTSRWFATSDLMITGRTLSNHMLIGVSSDDDPTHPWKAVEYLAKTAVDNMKLGLDKNGFYSTALAGSREESVSVPVIAIPKGDLLWKGQAVPSLANMNVFDVDAGSRLTDHKFRGVEGMVPAFDLDPNKRPGDPMIYVNRYRSEVDGETMIQLRRVIWTSSTRATLSEPTTIGLGTHYTVQPTTLGIQPPLSDGLFSPGIRAGEARIVNAVAKKGSVWAIAAAEIGSRTGAFWVEIDARTMKLVQHGTLSDPAADILFPSLNVDANGNLGIAMTHVSAREAASTYVTGRLASDPPGTLQPLVKAVEGRYVFFQPGTDLTKAGANVSWSDFSTMVVDPSDPTLLWSYQEAATNDCMPAETNAGKYGTDWVAFRVGSPGKKGTR